MIYVVGVSCIPYFILTMYCIAALSCNSKWINGLNFLSPVQFYHNVKVNLFGAFFVTLILNILFAPYAIVYWIYKLCTVGRK